MKSYEKEIEELNLLNSRNHILYKAQKNEKQENNKDIDI